MINFCFDKILDPVNKIVLPNLCGLDVNTTLEQLEHSRESLSVNFPYCDYPRLLDYAASEGVDYSISQADQAPVGSFYFININFFVTDLDYFSRLDPKILRLVQQKHVRLLFYYCEADVADRLDSRLQELCTIHGVSMDQIYFISHNTRARQFKNWFYFNDDEMLYYRTCNELVNDYDMVWHNRARTYKTTALVRTHKNWRAVFSGQLWRMGWPEHSLFSYCAHDHTDEQDIFDCSYKPELNKLNSKQTVDTDNTWALDATRLLDLVPIEIDQLNNTQRTRYRTFVPEFFYDSYWNIVIETHIDIENLPGVFITEKTWKPIAHYQPFVIMGCAGSLAHLRELGYMTFGDYIDESYDLIENHIERTYRVLAVCEKLAGLDGAQLQELNQKIQPILLHNRELFWSSKQQRVQALFDSLEA
jgi:hypothetical protein